MTRIRIVLGLLLAATLLASCAAKSPRGAERANSALVGGGISPVEMQARQLSRIQMSGEEVVRFYRMEIAGEDPGYSEAAQKAVETALGHNFEHCAEDYKGIPIEGDVLGGPGEGLIAVYLIPELGDPKQVPIGGFHRIIVDADTGQVTHRASMSRGCRTLSLSPSRANDATVVTSLLVNHAVTPYPLENHIFASMIYEVDLIVVTDRTTWKVEKGRIRALD